MIAESEILKMSVQERLDLMELIWTSLDSDDIPVPHWHEEILEARMKKIEAGEATFYTLDEVRQQMEDFKSERRQAATRTTLNNQPDSPL